MLACCPWVCTCRFGCVKWFYETDANTLNNKFTVIFLSLYTISSSIMNYIFNVKIWSFMSIILQYLICIIEGHTCIQLRYMRMQLSWTIHKLEACAKYGFRKTVPTWYRFVYPFAIWYIIFLCFFVALSNFLVILCSC